jgi:DNA-binding beta-propeller fold protein YncE
MMFLPAGFSPPAGRSSTMRPRLVHVYLPVLALLAGVPAQAVPVLTATRSSLVSGESTELTVTGASNTQGWDFLVRDEHGQRADRVEPHGADGAVYFAPPVAKWTRVRVRARSKRHPIEEAECQLTVKPMDPASEEYLLDHEGFSGVFPFRDLETGGRFGAGAPAEPWPGAPYSWQHASFDLQGGWVVKLGYGLPFRLELPAVKGAQRQLLSYGAAAQFTRMDVTGRSWVVIQCRDRVAQAGLEFLQEGKGAAWESHFVPLEMRVRGVVPLAGNGVAPGGHEDGKGVSARFQEPFGMALVPCAFDPSGGIPGRGQFLAVADERDQTVRVVTPDGAVQTLCGQPGTPGDDVGTWTLARFREPSFVAVAVERVPPASLNARVEWTLFVADTGNDRIQAVRWDGKVTTLAGVAGRADYQESGPGQPALFNRPRGLVYRRGWLYVADQGNAVIRRINVATGQTQLVAGIPKQPGSADGSRGLAQFTRPEGLALTQLGSTLLITDGNAIRQLDLGAASVRTLAGSVAVAAPAAADLVPGADQRLGWLRDQPCFDGPCGLAVDLDRDEVFIADRGNGVIRRMDLGLGRLVTLAGDLEPGDGPGAREVRYGLNRDGLPGRLGSAYAAVPGVRCLAPTFRSGEFAVSLGASLVQLGIGDRFDVTTLQKAPAPVLLEDAAPAAAEASTPARAAVGRPCVVAFTPGPPINAWHNEANTPRPVFYQVTVLDPGGGRKALAGAAWETEPVRVPVSFAHPGQALVQVRWVNDEGYSGYGQDLKVEVEIGAAQ